MATVDDLFEGSFRGARFLIKSASTSIGRKQILHEYPNSDKQKVEDLGLKPRSFSIKAIVSADPPSMAGGLSYFEKRDALLAALETPGNGTLSHPFFSNSYQVTARPATLDEDTTKLGEGSIDLVFDYSDIETDPIPAPTSLSQINQSLDAVNSAVNADIAEGWSISSALNFESATDLLGKFTDAVSANTSTFNSAGTPLNEFSNLVSTFSSDITELVQSPRRLADRLQGVVSSSAGLFQNVEQGLAVFSKFFSFGDDLISLDGITLGRIERNLNNQVIQQAVQTSYLALGYQFAAETDYQTVDDVDRVQIALEYQFAKLAEMDMDDAVMDSLSTMRVQVNQFLEFERINASQLVPIDTKEVPISVLAFQYYGAVDNLDEIVDKLIDINGLADVTFVSGEVEVLTI